MPIESSVPIANKSLHRPESASIQLHNGVVLRGDLAYAFVALANFPLYTDPTTLDRFGRGFFQGRQPHTEQLIANLSQKLPKEVQVRISSNGSQHLGVVMDTDHSHYYGYSLNKQMIEEDEEEEADEDSETGDNGEQIVVSEAQRTAMKDRLEQVITPAMQNIKFPVKPRSAVPAIANESDLLTVTRETPVLRPVIKELTLKRYLGIIGVRSARDYIAFDEEGFAAFASILFNVEKAVAGDESLQVGLAQEVPDEEALVKLAGIVKQAAAITRVGLREAGYQSIASEILTPEEESTSPLVKKIVNQQVEGRPKFALPGEPMHPLQPIAKDLHIDKPKNTALAHIGLEQLRRLSEFFVNHHGKQVSSEDVSYSVIAQLLEKIVPTLPQSNSTRSAHVTHLVKALVYMREVRLWSQPNTREAIDWNKRRRFNPDIDVPSVQEMGRLIEGGIATVAGYEARARKNGNEPKLMIADILEPLQTYVDGLIIQFQQPKEEE